MKHVNAALFVPFLGCPHRCSFCDQKAITGRETTVTPQDVTEVAQTAIASGADTKHGQIAFFGGSFTMLRRETMTALLAAAFPFVENGAFAGIRISTRPDAVSDDVLSLLKRYGVTTVELGCQSTDDGVLQRNGRGHTRADVENACRLVKAYGFELGVQMMTGLPGDSDAGALRTADELLSFGADTARIYPTLVLRGTPLAADYLAGRYAPQTLDEAVALCAKLAPRFEENGVPVIRLGLHAVASLRNNLLAGPFHPALRELVDGAVYLERMQNLLHSRPQGVYTITVGSRFLSRAAGHNGRNKAFFKDKGYTIRLQGDDALRLYEIRG